MMQFYPNKDIGEVIEMGLMVNNMVFNRAKWHHMIHVADLTSSEKGFVVEWLNSTQRHNRIDVAIALRQTQASKLMCQHPENKRKKH